MLSNVTTAFSFKEPVNSEVENIRVEGEKRIETRAGDVHMQRTCYEAVQNIVFSMID